MNPYNNQFYQRTYDIHPEGYNQQNEYLNSNEEEENEFEEIQNEENNFKQMNDINKCYEGISKNLYENEKKENIMSKKI